VEQLFVEAERRSVMDVVLLILMFFFIISCTVYVYAKIKHSEEMNEYFTKLEKAINRLERHAGFQQTDF
jgi:phosphoribosyl-dephospho-CoA transferase